MRQNGDKGCELPGDWTYTDKSGRKAIHEAGHVAVALHLGIEIGIVSVICNDEGGGYTEVCDDWVQQREPKRIEQRALVAMAGIASDVINVDPSKHMPPCNPWDIIYPERRLAI